MLRKVSLFPVVTLSRKVFLQYIMKVCRDTKISYSQERKIIEEFRKGSHGNYFEGMIFLESRSLYVFLHELIHHTARLLRGRTRFLIFYGMDYFVDEFDTWLFNKDKKRKFLIRRA